MPLFSNFFNSFRKFLHSIGQRNVGQLMCAFNHHNFDLTIKVNNVQFVHLYCTQRFRTSYFNASNNIFHERRSNLFPIWKFLIILYTGGYKIWLCYTPFSNILFKPLTRFTFEADSFCFSGSRSSIDKCFWVNCFRICLITAEREKFSFSFY